MTVGELTFVYTISITKNLRLLKWHGLVLIANMYVFMMLFLTLSTLINLNLKRQDTCFIF